MPNVAFDHVIIAAQDLEAEAERLLVEHGLASVAGGRHPGHGTRNRIVPLGNDYIELMGIVDVAEAATSPMGRWVSGELERGRRMLALSLRVDDIESVADRLGLRVMALSRARPDGRVLHCRLAGLEGAMGPERLPFFIQWDVPEEFHPGRDRVAHRNQPRGIAWAELGGDRERLAQWLGPHGLDLRVVEGEPGARAVAIGTRRGEIVLR